MIKDKEEIKKIWKELYERLQGECNNTCPKRHINKDWSCCNCMQEFGFIDGVINNGYFPKNTNLYDSSTMYTYVFDRLFGCPCICAINPDEVMLHLEQITEKGNQIWRKLIEVCKYYARQILQRVINT